MNVADDFLEAVDELIEAAKAVLVLRPGPRGFEMAFGRLQRAVDVLTLDDPPQAEGGFEAS